MTRRFRSPSAVALLVLAGVAACSGGSAAPMPDGAPRLGVIGGNHQSVEAAPAVKLPSQVVAQVVRLPSGQVAMTTRVLDALLPPKAFAQTAVNGIPGAVVCSVAPDPAHPLTPEVPCTNTDAQGLAYFTFHADSVAGVAKAEVRGTVNGTTHVSDSVSATVLPSTPVTATGGVSCTTGQSGCYAVHVGDTLDLHMTFTTLKDRYGNAVDPATVAAPGSAVGLLSDYPANPPTAPTVAGWTTTVEAQWAGQKVVLYVFMDGNRVVAWPLSVAAQ